MAQQQFRVSNAAGMWLRTEPVVSEATRKVLLPNGQLITKVADTDKGDWWRIRTTFGGTQIEGFSHKSLMVAVADLGSSSAGGGTSGLVTKTLAALSSIAPHARANYLEAIRQGGALFEQHGITTPQRMAHFLAQAMQETGCFTVLRESMSYSVPRMLEIFGVGHHSAKITAAEAPGLAHNEMALAERVYGLGNPRKAAELENTEPGDGFRYRGNGVLQTTGRGAHRRMGQACGVDFEGSPDLVTAPEHALKPALQEWSDGKLNQFADQNDIRTITLRINGGLNGFEERKGFFAKLLPLLS
jgi:putative chitinase